MYIESANLVEFTFVSQPESRWDLTSLYLISPLQFRQRNFNNDNIAFLSPEILYSGFLHLFGHFHAYRVYPRYQNSQIIMLSDGKEAINIEEWLNKPEIIHDKY